MPHVDDFQHVCEYLARRGLSLPESIASITFTPKMIAALYDQEVLLSSSEDAASQFMNFGYWHDGTSDKHAAQEHLLDKLIAGIHNREGNILDVACGTGATTRYIARHWSPGHVIGINVSARQIPAGRQDPASPTFLVMDAVALAFADHSFDNVTCVEAAFHFDTRETFLRECLRVLKTGGMLALTDILLHENGHDLLPWWLRSNFVPSLSDYAALVKEAGFSDVDVIDITEQGWMSYARHRFSMLHNSWLSGESDFGALQTRLAWMYRLAAAQKYNLLCFAKK